MRIHIDQIALRLTSVVLALLLWFTVAGKKSAEMVIPAPIELRNLPASLEVVGDIPRRMDVRLRGSAGLAPRLRDGDLYVAVDLAGAEPGSRTVFVMPGDVRVPYAYAATVVAVRPPSFQLTLERTMQKALPVKAKLTGRAAPGYRVVAVRCEPAEVTVEGPESRLATHTEVETQPVSVEQAQRTLVREVALAWPDPLLRPIEQRPIHVTAEVAPEK